MSTTETSSHAYDIMHVQVLNSSGSVLATLQTISNGSTADSWQSASFDLSAYKGQQIQVTFSATNGSINPTNFYVDDVALEVS